MTLNGMQWNLIAICGKSHSLSGKFFTVKSLGQHERDCSVCSSERDFNREYWEEIDDMPDDAFFALAAELGEL